MKGKILPFFIGLLIGAIIMTGGFLIYQNNNKHQGPGGMNGERPQMMQRQDGEQTNGEIPTQNTSDTTNTSTNS